MPHRRNTLDATVALAPVAAGLVLGALLVWRSHGDTAELALRAACVSLIVACSGWVARAFLQRAGPAGANPAAPHPEPLTQGPSPPAPGAEPPHVLVIDDDAGLLSLLAAYLRNAGYRVSAAARGEGGLQLALSDRPDVAVVDLLLPGMDGRVVCRRLRQAGIPVVILSGLAPTGDRVECEEWIVKGEEPAKLLAAVAALASRPAEAVTG